MLTQQDLKQIAQRGISEEQINTQLKQFETGFPFLRLEAAAAVGNGIVAPNENERQQFVAAWLQYKDEGKRVVKFVPASGAASRMFKNMFAFVDAPYDVPTTDFEKKYFNDIEKFAFYDALNEVCLKNEGKTIKALIAAGNYKAVAANMLKKEGLNYGQLPKGMLLFHKYAEGARTPMEEHLVEGALYAASPDPTGGEKMAHVHFTVSHEHIEFFKQKVAEKADGFEKKYGIKYDITFSEQKPSTDTVAANPDNTPFREADGSLLFRPGGHGALIENLNEIDADVIFIKNIDNVVPDRLKPETVEWKQVIAGVLVTVQRKAFEYLRLLDKGATESELEEIADFVENCLCTAPKGNKVDAEYLRRKLNRPMRVCGVVKNVGEPGGGPFLTYNQDGTVSLQILESSQIDTNNEAYMKMFTQGTHFNPVDLVCAVRDYKGQPFNLPDFVDKTTGFISSKSKGGKELKALELPGLWNGAMSDWSTIFVEVPLGTFNPVKTVNDLLRDQHQ